MGCSFLICSRTVVQFPILSSNVVSHRLSHSMNLPGMHFQVYTTTQGYSGTVITAAPLSYQTLGSIMVFLSSAARPSVALLVLILAPISTFSFPLPPDNLTLAEQIFPPAIIYRSLRDADRSDDTVTAPSQPPFPYFRRTFLFGTSQPSSRLAQQLNVTIITPYKDSERFIGAAWWGMGVLALILILVTGLLAGLTLGVMSVDLTRLRVWNRTGNRERR